MELDPETSTNHIYHCNFRFRKRLFELARPEKGSRRSSNYREFSEKVLIDYDGSVSARALLYLIRDTLLRSSSELALEHKCLPLPFTFSILFIYDNVGWSTELVKKELNFLRAWQDATWSKFGLDFPVILSSLEASLLSVTEDVGTSDEVNKISLWRVISASQKDDLTVDGTMSSDLPLPFDLSLNSHLVSIADNIKTLTCRKDFLLQMRQNLVVSIGHGLSVKKIITAENQTSMAIKMFSLMSLGRGAQLAEQMVFVTHIQGIKFTRPLMDLAQTDLQDYLKCIEWDKTSPSSDMMSSSLLVVDQSPLKKKVVQERTIESQCEEFIVDLQKNYPSTVPTLTRIGSKLQPSSPSSHLVINNEGDNTRITNHSTCSFCKKNQETGTGTFGLCYGCTNILRDMKDQSLFMKLIHQP